MALPTKKSLENQALSSYSYENGAPALFKISVIFPSISQNSQKQVLRGSISVPSDSTVGSLQKTSASPSSKTSPYFVSIYNLASIFGFIPFKIGMEENGSYRIFQLPIWRKVICAAFHLTALGTFLHQSFNRIATPSTSVKVLSNIGDTFEIVAELGSWVLFSLMLFTVWRKQSDILEIAERTRVHLGQACARKHSLIGILLFLGSYTSSIYMTYYFSAKHEQAIDNVDEEWGLKWSMAYLLRYILANHVMAVQVYGNTANVITALGMRLVQKEFSSNLEETLRGGDLNMGLQHYMDMKRLSGKINQTFGNQLLAYYIISVAYFAKIPEASVWRQGGEAVSMLTFFGLGSVMWLVSAEFHMDIRDDVQNWATQMQDLDDLPIDTRIKLLSIVNDNLLDPIGISCKFFTVTYGFLGSMLGLIVTYAIIVFQMQAKPQQNWASAAGLTSPSPLANTEL